MNEKTIFEKKLQAFVKPLGEYVATHDGQWTVKGFIDVLKNIYTISSDTKIVSKILEIHLFPKILEFAQSNGYQFMLANHQNYYPDISLVKNSGNREIRFALDFKTTYRNPLKPRLCNGFTLGSHGEYFVKRDSTKNIQFPYHSYAAHFCLGIIYDRVDADSDETKIHSLNDLKSIASVARNFEFFAAEKWKIASDKGGSGNTANIGSIKNISHILAGRGMFSKLGEKWFDDYWMNYGKIVLPNGRKITTLDEFVRYRRGDVSKIVKPSNE